MDYTRITALQTPGQGLSMQNPLNGILSRLIKLIFKHPKFVNSFIPVCITLLCRVIPTSESLIFL